jgi:hypothetical protein
MTDDIMQWQRDLRSMPRVWLVVSRCSDGEETLSIYADEQGARCELEWRQTVPGTDADGRRVRYLVREESVQTLDLAVRRFGRRASDKGHTP